MDAPGGRQSSLSVPETVLLLATSSPFQVLPSLFKSSQSSGDHCPAVLCSLVPGVVGTWA